MKSPTASFAIKKLMAEKNMSREQLAKASGLTVRTIQSMELGEKFISERSAAAIAKATGTTFSILFTDIKKNK